MAVTAVMTFTTRMLKTKYPTAADLKIRVASPAEGRPLRSILVEFVSPSLRVIN
jgi:hypothetical protein